MGVSRADLKQGDITISARDQKITGWEFTGPGPWYGLVHKQKDPAPTQDIMVNLSEHEHPVGLRRLPHRSVSGRTPGPSPEPIVRPRP